MILNISILVGVGLFLENDNVFFGYIFFGLGLGEKYVFIVKLNFGLYFSF